MTRTLIVCFLIACFCFFLSTEAVSAKSASARSTPKRFDFNDPKQMNAISLTIDAPWEPVVGYADEISGTANFDPAHPKATTGKIIVAVSSVKFTNPGYTQTARFYALHEKQHPEITCELKKIKRIRTVRPGLYRGTVAVDFSCRGITKTLTVPLEVTYIPGVAKQRFPDYEGDLLVVRCQFTIRRSDFGIAKDAPLQEVSDEIEIRVAIVGTEKRPVAAIRP